MTDETPRNPMTPAAAQVPNLTVDQITAAALNLPPEEREELLDAILATMHDDREMDPALMSTIDRRFEELRSGKVKGIPAEDVIRGLEDLVR